MILAIESSTTRISLALVSPEETRELNFAIPRNRGGEMFSRLQDLLTPETPLTRVVVGLGPGSYNGIRSALSAGWGISAARHVPLVGLSSLLGLAEGRYSVIGDARRRQAYFASVEDGAFVEPPHLLELSELPEKLASLGDCPLLSPSGFAEVPAATITPISAARLAALGGKMAPQSLVPEPIYLKPAYINLAPARVS